jgi:fumarylacetoacetase
VVSGPATWLPLAPADPFGVANLPYGAFRTGSAAGVGVRVGGHVLDLSRAERAGLLDAAGALAGHSNLDGLLAAGAPVWRRVRERLQQLLSEERWRGDVEPLLVPLDQVRPVLPFTVGDYVDFYSSEQHAGNLGRILRPGQPPVLPNWHHLPVAYHGRAGTVVVSGTPVRRPCGQRKEGDGSVFGPSVRLDIEAEVGFVVGRPSRLGDRVSTEDFAEHVFGAVLVNDWSARDIQAWEYQPLGPFLGKSFATTISAWVVPLDALTAARVPAPAQDPPVLAYLQETARQGYDLTLCVEWNGTVVSRPPFRDLYWTPAQQLAHLTVNGASLRTGDLFASGTVSGARRDQTGSFIELTWNGSEPVTLADGSQRTFLQDGDTVTISATAPGPDGAVIGFGDVTATIQPAQ